MKHVNKILAGLITCCVILLLSGCSPRQGEKHDFSIGKGTFLLDGKPFVIKAAEIHYTRIPAEYWQHRIQMCKALGMNTICIYAFWNIHEQKPGEFDFKGQNDIAAFCRLAQKEGMYIMLRPGPYVCSEWEMGGLPWWLLKKEDIKLRTNDPYFFERTKLFMNEIGKQLADLQVTRGGNIIMVQVENEYGAYATDKAYIANIRDAVKAAGFTDVPLFQCDWSSTFQLNGLDDLVWTINFGTGANIDAQFKKLKEARPDAPLMCSEFWSGWFDHWGRKHETRDAGVMVSGIKDMLDRHISFSLYMAHGGTTFGHWGGANSPAYSAMCSSYDYDAPISEAGWVTPKFDSIRNVIRKYVTYDVPEAPAPIPLIEIPSISLTKVADVLALAKEGEPVASPTPLTFEQLNQGYGYVLYSTHFNQPLKGRLEIPGLRDYATIYVDGERVGELNRCFNQYAMEIDIPFNATLDILVENMGRINYGEEIVRNTKGIISPVKINGSEISDWKMYKLPMDRMPALASGEPYVYKNGSPEVAALGNKPVLYEGTFHLSDTGDTFIDMEDWGKGIIFINGINIGRYWYAGPQQTLYIPGVWLNKGENKIVIYEQLNNDRKSSVRTVKTPVLTKLKKIAAMEKKNRLMDKAVSPFSVDETMRRIEEIIKSQGGSVFAVFDHGRNASEVGMKLPPNKVIVFGSPKVGTLLMQQDPSISLELPLRISVWEDADGKVWIGSPNLETIASEYGMENSGVIEKMQEAVTNIVSKSIAGSR